MARILCIEDSAETRILIKKTLEAAGMVVDTVWGGEKGLEAAIHGQFDCILLDLTMADTDGHQVLEKLKHNKKTSELPVVIVSACVDQENINRAKQAGAAGYLTKPFLLETLVNTVRSVMA